MVDNIFIENLIKWYGDDGIVFWNNMCNSKKIENDMLVEYKKNAEDDQTFIYKDSAGFYINFALPYIQSFNKNTKFYNDIILNIIDGEIFTTDGYNVNYSYILNSNTAYKVNDEHPIYIIEYFDKEYSFLVIDGNHRISNMIDLGYKTFNSRLLFTNVTIGMINGPTEMFYYVYICSKRLLERNNNICDNKIYNVILNLIKSANFYFDCRYGSH